MTPRKISGSTASAQSGDKRKSTGLNRCDGEAKKAKSSSEPSAKTDVNGAPTRTTTMEPSGSTVVARKIDKGKKLMSEPEAKKVGSSSLELLKQMASAVMTWGWTAASAASSKASSALASIATPVETKLVSEGGRVGVAKESGVEGASTVVASQYRTTSKVDVSLDEYEVFLSFRGPDTRQGFTDVLYNCLVTAGIRVFKDDSELEIGDRINTILIALENSKICIPIFSKTFASSAWCLREVAKMVELGKEIVPIFYKVTPSDVRLLGTGSFKTELQKHEERHGKDLVKKWENALKEVARIMGREVKNTGYINFCRKLVEDVQVKLKPNKGFDDPFVGGDVLVERAMELLDVHSGDDVYYIGIHGMGGIGKTTLARFVFNKISSSFDGCSFLEDIREKSERYGFEALQEKLVKDLTRKSTGQYLDFPEMIGRNFRKRKILIVLDDVDKWMQIKKLAGESSWFGSGSRIIITTRDIKVLKTGPGGLRGGIVKHIEMKTLSSTDALRLFCIHAFGEESPTIDFKDLSEEAVATTGGLPLTLTVMGSHLRNEDDKACWTDVICRSKKIPLEEVQTRLRISYDKLGDDQKKIFLDIACFFVGMDKTYPLYMWEACGYHPSWGLKVLSSKSLVKTLDNGKIWMHDQLRDLGRHIARENDRDDPLKHSRVWMYKDALKVLRSKENKEKIEGLRLEGNNPIDLREEEIGRLRSLRFLELRRVILKEDCKDCFSNLRWLSWHYAEQSTSYFDSTNLVVLDFSHSSIREHWCGWSKLQMAKNLKVLNLTGCSKLTSTPNLSNNTTLERLILKDCRDLVEIHYSIGNLKKLKHLDLRGCHSLRKLPEEVEALEDLEEILVKGIGGILDLPNSIGNLRSLLSIELRGVEITRIPNTIGGLLNLTRLSMSKCTGLEKLPDALGELKSLVELDLSGTRVSMLPNSIGQLAKLESLSLERTKIEELPSSIKNLKSLETLFLELSELESLPNCVGDMARLKHLSVASCKIKNLPRSIGKLTQLRSLNADECYSLTGIPEEIGNLSGLTYLGLTTSCIAELAPIVNRLSHLELLTVTIHEGSSSSEKEVRDSSGHDLGIEKLTNPAILRIHCSGLKCIPQLPSTLSELELSDATTATKLPDFTDLKDLRFIRFMRCALNDDKLESLQALRTLETVILDRCTKNMVKFCCQLEYPWRDLTIVRSSVKVLDWSHTVHLQTLILDFCKELAEVRGLGKLESLQHLEILQCPCLEIVRDVSELKRLRSIDIRWCSKPREIEGLERLFMESICIEDCRFLRNIDELKKRCQQGQFDGLFVENYIYDD